MGIYLCSFFLNPEQSEGSVRTWRIFGEYMLEHEWGKKAFKSFPDLIERFDNVDSPGELWIELRLAFDEAYKEPRNEDLIARIYQYAEWCCTQQSGTSAEDDLGSIVCATLYEDIPTIPAALADMPRWFPRADVILMKYTFSYMVGEEGLARILQVYDVAGKKRKT